jgi:hypothetical protein
MRRLEGTLDRVAMLGLLKDKEASSPNVSPCTWYRHIR